MVARNDLEDETQEALTGMLPAPTCDHGSAGTGVAPQLPRESQIRQPPRESRLRLPRRRILAFSRGRPAPIGDHEPNACEQRDDGSGMGPIRVRAVVLNMGLQRTVLRRGKHLACKRAAHGSRSRGTRFPSD